jgi:hypothetical protein
VAKNKNIISQGVNSFTKKNQGIWLRYIVSTFMIIKLLKKERNDNDNTSKQEKK